ncbi:lamin tail domain-containing protein [Pedobacter sp. BG31]|uniref:lamin tail domain-containing protein n=1 Tax=Pedobacter sp. BG31 TaxID=3349697 RepID=UPI0035F272D9
MKKPLLFILFLLVFVNYLSAQVSLTAINTAKSENFDGMTSTGTSTVAGWSAVKASGTNTATVGSALPLVVYSTSSNSGAAYNVGTAGASDRSFGSLASGALVPRFGAGFQNNTGATVTSIDLSGVMEQWRTGSNATVNEKLNFEYSFNATGIADANATWLPLTGMDLNEKLTTTTAAAGVDGNLPANQTAISGNITGITWVNGATLYIRWTDTDDLGSDGIYAVDDFSITPNGSATATPVLSASNTALVFGDQNINSNSTAQSYTLGGSNLTANVAVNATAPFSVSKDNVTFSNAISYTTAEVAASPLVYVRFSPTVAGNASGNITNTSTGTSAVNVAVSGNGLSSILTVNQTAFDFGSQNTGTNSTAQTFNLSATGLTDVVNVTTTAPFYLSKDNVTYSTSLVYTVAELATSKTVSVRFIPTTTGPESGNISISSNGASTQNITTAGVGTTPPVAATHVVISEVYGGGGNTGSTYKNDFIELYNPGNTAVDLTGWSVQYLNATGTGTWAKTDLTGSIPAKSFYLVQEAVGAGGTVNLPTPDAIGTLTLSGTTGKVILSNSNVLLTGANPSTAAVVDKVGFGPTATGFETATTPAISNTTSIERKASATSTAATLAVGGAEEFNGNGYDTDNNSTDFVVTSPNPQNSSVKEPTGANHVVISEVYGGGGNSGAVYKNDFIELYNPTLSAVDLTGWSVQYASATGTGNWTVTTLSGSIAPKGFYLIQQSAGTGGTTNLPIPDKIGTITMSGTAGKVLLSNSTTAQTGSLPTGATVIDLVGFGATANGFEGTAPAPAPSNTSSIERKASATSDANTMGTGGTEEFAGNGYDSDQNAADFIVRTPNPQNSSVTEPVSTSGPYLVVTPKTLAFSNQAINTTSAAKTYVLSAGNLTNNTTLTVTGPFSISKDNTTFANTLSYTIADLATNQTVYVKFSPTAVGNANGAIIHASAGATSVSLALSGPAIDPNQTAFNFENCTTVGSAALSDGFYQYSVTGPQTWGCTTTFGHDASDPTGAGSAGNALQINGYSGGNILNEDWLISPALNISSFNYAILSFWTRSAFAGDKLQLKISTNYTGSGNPALATWTNLDGKFPETGSDKWTKSDNIDLSAYKATPVYVAIVYNSTTSSASRWTVDDFAVTNSNTPPAVDITTSPSSISFGFQAANTTSAANSFGFSAGNLTGDVTLNAPANFTLSKTSTGTYTSTITYPKADINNTSPTVYAKFSPTAVNTSYTGNVTITTSASANKTVALSGNTFDIANTLEVVNWNIEWFGSPAQDPSNDALQAANVKTIVNNLNADIYGFAEVVDTTLFRNTVLPAGYNVVFSEFGSYADNKADADFPLAQKLAFMYRTDQVKPISTLGILRDTYNPAVPSTSADGTPYKNWSSGRFPYMMQAQVKINNKLDTVYFVEIHAKANTGTTADQIDSYNRRKAGNKQLKDWLDANLAGKKIIILGDFNDVLDADKTIAPMPAGTGTSYVDFTQDAANYFPVTLPLSLAGKQSTAGFNTVIDNVIISKSLNLNYIPASAEVLDAVKNLVTNYSSTTTDHYPIKTRYLFGNGAPTIDAVANQAVCYSSTNQNIDLTGISAGPETTQNTTLSVTSDNANLFDVLTVAANGTDKGTVTYHLKNNVRGVANITVTVMDNGGTDFGGVDKTTSTFKLTVTSTATATVTGTAAVCLNGTRQTITFTGANGTAPYTFTYNINGGASQTVSTTAASASVTVSAPTNIAGAFTYNLVNVKDANCGQPQTGSATITVNALPVVSISSNKGLSVSKGDVMVLTATGGGQYSWTGADILSGQNTAALTIRPKQSGTYRVSVTNASGCVSDQNIAITVIEDYKLEAGTVITPNGDGYNDKFIVKNIDYYPNNTLKIFDKAGRILYTKHTYANDWDGTINGSPLNEGTYYYIIDLGNGIGTFKGYINIIRD